ncbi:unnamed protein product [Dibothriocephalus latus]|uniref:Ankyrin repeat domain-containing protein n=1 Tax=Dibothriocephalus latus TaxID=60516 RepID=A0A3P7NM13_DIBLA|nr:unnamed protein product [Dibothriocephalus latus]
MEDWVCSGSVNIYLPAHFRNAVRWSRLPHAHLNTGAERIAHLQTRLRSKSGIWGWRSDRTESVNGHECSVCSAANVQIVTLRRTEHLTEEDLRALQESHSAEGESRVSAMPGSTNPLTNLLNASEHEHAKSAATTIVTNEAASYNPNNISIEEYFSQDANAKPKREVGRPKVMTAKLKTYKAHLYLCEEYPVSLKDQVLPIVELMAEYNPYFFKLQEFLTKQLPSGFPMKIGV